MTIDPEDFLPYIPYSRRTLADHTPQSSPERFSDDSIRKEVRMLINMNIRGGSSVLRTIAYTRLEQFMRERRNGERITYYDDPK